MSSHMDELTVQDEKDVSDLIRKVEDVVSETVIAQFDAVVQSEERMQWIKGDLTNEIWASVQAAGLKNKRGKPYTFLDICHYVSVRFLKGARSYNTVKAWALVCRRFSKSVRALYHSDDLPFSHFAYASKELFSGDGVDNQYRWQDVLEYSWQYYIEHMRSPSVAQLADEFEEKSRKEKPDRAPFQTGTREFADIRVDPIEIGQLETFKGVEVPIEVQVKEALFRLGGLVPAFVEKYPNFRAPVVYAYSLLETAVGKLFQSLEFAPAESDEPVLIPK